MIGIPRQLTVFECLLQLALDVVFLVIVEAIARSFGGGGVGSYFVAAGTPIEVGSQGRRGKENFNTRIVMPSQCFV